MDFKNTIGKYDSPIHDIDRHNIEREEIRLRDSKRYLSASKYLNGYAAALGKSEDLLGCINLLIDASYVVDYVHKLESERAGGAL